MKGLSVGLSASVAIHAAIVAVFIAVAATGGALQSRVIEVDFTVAGLQGVEEGAGQSHGADPNIRAGMKNRGLAASRYTSVSKGTQGRHIAASRPSAALEKRKDVEDRLQPAHDQPSKGILSDEGGSAETQGVTGSTGGSKGGVEGDLSGEANGTSLQDSGSGDGEGRVVRYGSGSSDEKGFRYIRDDILKNVRYPETARRRGWEGKTLLSFVVSENGSVHDIKIINSSGFSELDRSAREAISRTRFSQKVPYRLVVILPIEYRLE